MKVDKTVEENAAVRIRDFGDLAAYLDDRGKAWTVGSHATLKHWPYYDRRNG